MVAVWLLFFFSVNVEGFFFFPKIEKFYLPGDADAGISLYLTPLLEEGKYEEAQQLSRVKPDLGNITSYSGFFTINKQCQSNLFFWFFPAQKGQWKDAPLLLWLEGGPGLTSLYSILLNIGPLKYHEGELQKQEFSWNLETNLLLIDQPVGTGYSFTKSGCYAKNETDVGEDLYKALIQFYQLFPELVKNNFFISGQSYAGHYIPALGHAIHKYNPGAEVKISLTAMMIGNGLSDAETQLDYGNHLYYLGLIDDAARDVYNQNYKQFVQDIKDKNWNAATKLCDAFRGFLYDRFVDRKVNMFNYIDGSSISPRNLSRYIQSAEFRKALQIGYLPFHSFPTVYRNLRNDIVQSVKPWVEELLEFYPIVFYNGQLDLACAYPLTINFLRSLDWSGKEQYLNSNRTKWCLKDDLAGYYKGGHNLYDVLIRDAGHAVTNDQPLWALTLISSVTLGTPDNPLHALTPC
ncbi:hypothetical protein J6590_076459 [Homalodisca vitripennis]|nr:hypothetical protein J6590_076459 [Homalodisca vitripennis]